MDDVTFSLRFNATCCECCDCDTFTIYGFDKAQEEDETIEDVRFILSCHNWKMDDSDRIRCPNCQE